MTAACGGRGAQSPTPFPTTATTPIATAQGPVVLTVTELAAAQGLYVDSVVQLTGRFKKQPLLACDTEPHPSPARWALVEEGVTILAGGFDEQVRALLPEDLLMSVEGRWRRWVGLVGCGKQAVEREVWFLNVSRILSPSPLTQVTLTPGGFVETGGTEVAGLPPAPEGQITIEALPTLELPGLPTVPASETPELLVPTELPEDVGGTPAGLVPTLPIATTPPSVSPTFDPLAPTPTPSGTPDLTTTPAGSLTPTVTGTPPTPAVTGTGAPGTLGQAFDLFEIEEFLGASTLEAGRYDSWSAELTADSEFSVYAIAPAPADIVLSLVRDGQPIVDRQNTSPAGAPEVLRVSNLPGDDEYEIQVATQGGAATQYAIIANFDPELPLTFSGFVAPGSPRSGVQVPVDNTHFWFFIANAGDQLTITVTPDSASDPYIELYGPDGLDIDSMDEGFEGDVEVLTVDLTDTGMHAIAITDVVGVNMTYSLSITLN